MARIPSVVTNQGDEIRILSEERRKNGFLPSAEKTSRTAFWSTDESVGFFPHTPLILSC